MISVPLTKRGGNFEPYNSYSRRRLRQGPSAYPSHLLHATEVPDGRQTPIPDYRRLVGDWRMWRDSNPRLPDS